MKEPAADNPILNGPYDEPAYHYSTDASGNLNYADIRTGRRIFAPDVPQIPLNQSPQGSMFDLNDSSAEYRDEIVNKIREHIAQWRSNGYPGITSRVTRDLLQFWFANPERQSWQNLFFAQREAIEAAIWLNEIAARSNPGTHLLNQIRQAQKTAGDQAEDHLPRLAFKMATGTGKTVVMACLILYHYLNRQEARADTRFADYFLLIAPGITIRDRLSVLLWDSATAHPQEARDYYRQRNLVPPDYLSLMQGLNSRVVIANCHAFEARLLSGNKKNPFVGKRLADGSNFMVPQVFFCGGDKDEFGKWKRGLSDLAKQKAKRNVERTLKVEIADEAFDRLYGFISHPIPAEKGRKIAVRAVSQFGEESSKVPAASWRCIRRCSLSGSADQRSWGRNEFTH